MTTVDTGAVDVSTLDMSTAVLGRPARRGRFLQRLAALASGQGSVLERSLPSTAMFAGAALLLAGRALPVTDGELVLAGLATAFLATLVAPLVTRSSPAGDGALVVPLGHLGAVALLSAGTGSATVLFLVLGPLLTLVATPGRRGVLLAVLGTAVVLLLPGPLATGSAASAALPGALLLGPFTVGLGGLAVNETLRRLGGQAAEIARLQNERAALLTQVQSRADELDLATRMLAARAQTMTSVIDAVTEQSIIGTDRDGVIRVWNPGAEKMLGLPRSEVVRRRSIVEFHLPEELETAAETLDTAMGSIAGLDALVHAAQHHGSDVRDWTYVAAGGEQRTVSVAITPRTDDRGVHAGWNFVGTDMTETRATERMKDQFVSLISHELRTPLTSILGYLELVLDDNEQPLTDEQRTYLTTVERNADRLLRLVGDLLFTAQVDAGRFTLHPQDVDLATVVRSAEETARVTAAAAGVEVTIDVPEDGLVVAGDAVRLGQACDNLVSNAVKFTPSGGQVTLSLCAAWQTPDGEVVEDERPGSAPVARLSVSDTGIGIPSGEQGKLFTRFFRASTAQRNAVPGVGLGLAITKAITTAHGGMLDLVSAEGAGTTFTLTLPRPTA
jgi:PAS domain S-box-containing protein